MIQLLLLLNKLNEVGFVSRLCSPHPSPSLKFQNHLVHLQNHLVHLHDILIKTPKMATINIFTTRCKFACSDYCTLQHAALTMTLDLDITNIYQYTVCRSRNSKIIAQTERTDMCSARVTLTLTDDLDI